MILAQVAELVGRSGDRRDRTVGLFRRSKLIGRNSERECGFRTFESVTSVVVLNVRNLARPVKPSLQWAAYLISQ